MHDDKKAKINVVPPEIRVRISGGTTDQAFFANNNKLHIPVIINIVANIFIKVFC